MQRPTRASALATDGDLILTLGAGNVVQVVPLILEALHAETKV